MKKRNEDLSFYEGKSVSIIGLTKDFLMDSKEVRETVEAHDRMVTGIKVVGWGLFGLFVVKKFTSK